MLLEINLKLRRGHFDLTTCLRQSRRWQKHGVRLDSWRHSVTKRAYRAEWQNSIQQPQEYRDAA